jgi:peptide methionine sulfoxide reductase msrA/msrB
MTSHPIPFGRIRPRALFVWLVALVTFAVAGALAGCTKVPAKQEPTRSDLGVTSAAKQEPAPRDLGAETPRRRELTQEDLRARLSPLAFAVTQEAATEPPFQNAYWDEHRPGLYVDVIDGTPLFSSRDKFDSGTGWPSFTQPLAPHAVTTREDSTHFMTRTEVRSASSGAHLGHVFSDGPAPAHTRFCMNSASLRFVPAEELVREGYGTYASAVGASAIAASEAAACAPARAGEPSAGTTGPSGCEATTEVAILAGGCFWGMEDILRKVPGVLETTAGYTGGTTAKPTYDDVHTGYTGHAEAVRIVFDPKKVTFASLLDDWFFRMHDPTTPNRQGNDRGSQYRSAIFATSEDQLAEARAAKARAEKSGRWRDAIVTEISRAGAFTPAEGYHQRYLERNPSGYTCHYLRD